MPTWNVTARLYGTEHTATAQLVGSSMFDVLRSLQDWRVETWREKFPADARALVTKIEAVVVEKIDEVTT